ncbi:DUF4292 domain-containing protein [Desertivirga xinjiangensis]|uniref:DUF4292 domain-containing protein n=1 Tax=Desertivirga xinjiangensis TaxID=539206 RepID=UPI00210BB962|nr:DUF4292 domain-containing protein [Pedobacter xinjiangensis]
MRKNILNKVLCVVLTGLTLFAASACKTKKATLPASPAPLEKERLSSGSVMKNVQDKQPTYTTLSVKAKADLNINNNTQDVSMNIRMRNGEAIWVSVTAIAGIEVARALITPDSIKVLNRLQSEYLAKPFNYIHQFTNKQVSFNTVQSLFTATMMQGITGSEVTVGEENSQTVLSGNVSGLLYKLLFNSRYNLVQSNLTDRSSGKNLLVNYANFVNISGKEFPQDVSIRSDAQNRSVKIDLHYNSIIVNEAVDFPFNVPKRFTVKN